MAKRILSLMLILCVISGLFTGIPVTVNAATYVNSVDCRYNNGKVYADVTFDNMPKNGILILSVYQDGGKFVYCKSAEVKKDAQTTQIEFDADESYIDCNVKILLWESMNTMNPLSGVFTTIIKEYDGSINEFDAEKQKQAVESLESMFTVLDEEAFSKANGEYEVINPVLEAISEVLGDAEEGIAIYEDNYIKNTYGALIDQAFGAYEKMTPKNKGSFQSKLVKLKKEHYDEVNELSKLLFNKSIDEIENIVNKQ